NCEGGGTCGGASGTECTERTKRTTRSIEHGRTRSARGRRAAGPRRRRAPRRGAAAARRSRARRAQAPGRALAGGAEHYAMVGRRDRESAFERAGMKMRSIAAMMKQAQMMRSGMQEVQDEVGQKTVEASAGGGMVNVT